MLIFDDRYQWKGWGGNLGLGRGTCRLQIFDLKKSESGRLAHLRSTLVVLEDVPDSPISVRGFVGHIATSVARDFSINPARMMVVEHYPAVIYGENRQRSIGEKYEAVEFLWHEGKAIHPKWRPLPEAMIGLIKQMEAAGLSCPDDPESA